jgi:hypothetical protein
MELHLTPEQEARLAEIARHQGIAPDDFVSEIALGLIEEDDREREIIRQRIAQADAGIFIEEDEMDRRVQRMTASLPR